LTAEGKKAFSASASAITFHINAADKATAETVKEKLWRKAKDLVQTVEIKDDVIKRLGKHVTKKIKTLGTSDITVDIGKDVR